MRKYLYYGLIVAILGLAPVIIVDANEGPAWRSTNWNYGSGPKNVTNVQAVTGGRCSSVGRNVDGELESFPNNVAPNRYGALTVNVYFNEQVGESIAAIDRRRYNLNNNRSAARTNIPNAIRSGQGFYLPVRVVISGGTAAQMTTLERQILHGIGCTNPPCPGNNFRPLEISLTDVSSELSEDVLEFTHVMEPVGTVRSGGNLTVYYELPQAFFNMRAGLTAYTSGSMDRNVWEPFGRAGWFYTEFSLCPKSDPDNNNRPLRETYQINYTFFVPNTDTVQMEVPGAPPPEPLHGTITCHYNIVQELFLSASRSACLTNDRYRLLNNFEFTPIDLTSDINMLWKFEGTGTNLSNRVLLNWTGFFRDPAPNGHAGNLTSARNALRRPDNPAVGINFLTDPERTTLRRLADAHRANPRINPRCFTPGFLSLIQNNSATGPTEAGTPVNRVNSIRASGWNWRC